MSLPIRIDDPAPAAGTPISGTPVSETRWRTGMAPARSRATTPPPGHDPAAALRPSLAGPIMTPTKGWEQRENASRRLAVAARSARSRRHGVSAGRSHATSIAGLAQW